jgi:hypothetical protein
MTPAATFIATEVPPILTDNRSLFSKEFSSANARRDEISVAAQKYFQASIYE